MHVEIHGICLGNVPRRRNKEVEKLTFSKNNIGMLKQKQQKIGNPS
jgi:hypothetical protein